nr:MAG TPA: hypothetical protein [Caudoviricetes sp.]
MQWFEIAASPPELAAVFIWPRRDRRRKQCAQPQRQEARPVHYKPHHILNLTIPPRNQRLFSLTLVRCIQPSSTLLLLAWQFYAITIFKIIAIKLIRC